MQVILGVAVLIRILYGVLLIFRSHTRGIFSKWFFENDEEQTGYVEGTRQLRPWRQIWRMLIETYVSPTLGLLQSVREFIWKMLKKAGSLILERIGIELMTCAECLFRKVADLWLAVRGQGQGRQGGQGGPEGDFEMT